MGNVPACVSIVRVAKNVIVRHVAKPVAVITGHNCRFTLIEILVGTESYFSWPYRGSSRKWIGGAPGKDIIFRRAQSPKQGFGIDDEAVMRLSCWGGPIIFKW